MRLEFDRAASLVPIAPALPAHAVQRCRACGSGPSESAGWARTEHGAPNGGIPGASDDANLLGYAPRGR